MDEYASLIEVLRDEDRSHRVAACLEKIITLLPSTEVDDALFLVQLAAGLTVMASRTCGDSDPLDALATQAIIARAYWDAAIRAGAT